MTVNKTISIPDDLYSLMENFNLRHPYEKLNISQIAQKAIFQKISNEDPELLSMLKKKEQVKHIQKPIQTKHTFETVCIECGKSFTAERKTRKFCSGKCKTAYGRKSNK